MRQETLAETCMHGSHASTGLHVVDDILIATAPDALTTAHFCNSKKCCSIKYIVTACERSLLMFLLFCFWTVVHSSCWQVLQKC